MPGLPVQPRPGFDAEAPAVPRVANVKRDRHALQMSMPVERAITCARLRPFRKHFVMYRIIEFVRYAVNARAVFAEIDIIDVPAQVERAARVQRRGHAEQQRGRRCLLVIIRRALLNPDTVALVVDARDAESGLELKPGLGVRGYWNDCRQQNCKCGAFHGTACEVVTIRY